MIHPRKQKNEAEKGASRRLAEQKNRTRSQSDVDNKKFVTGRAANRRNHIGVRSPDAHSIIQMFRVQSKTKTGTLMQPPIPVSKQKPHIRSQFKKMNKEKHV